MSDQPAARVIQPVTFYSDKPFATAGKALKKDFTAKSAEPDVNADVNDIQETSIQDVDAPVLKGEADPDVADQADDIAEDDSDDDTISLG